MLEFFMTPASLLGSWDLRTLRSWILEELGSHQQMSHERKGPKD